MNYKEKNRVLVTLVGLIKENSSQIIETNIKDINSSTGKNMALIERLKIDSNKIEGMVRSLESIIKLNDPEGKILQEYNHTNGLKIVNRCVPFGNVLILYESRPDVTIEAAALAFKSGNRVLLKGGKEAINTNLFLIKLWKRALHKCNQDINCIEYLDFNRSEIQKVIKGEMMNIDLIIPRGGEGLINYITKNSTIPIIAGGRGNNFLYIHSRCNLSIAINIILDGKTRIGVCNALDNILIDKSLPDLNQSIDIIIDNLWKRGIEVIDFTNINIAGSPLKDGVLKALEEEFLSKKILIGVVNSQTEAISIINRHSGKHSATIITECKKAAEEFMEQTDCAVVYHNASTRFSDGGEFGLGAEIAISTQKLHFRGPIGLEQFVTNKWFVFGNGQVRNLVVN